MTIWKPDPASLKRPIYLSLVKAVEQDIRFGVLNAGDQLPTHRELAYDLGISIQTVSRAYEELVRRNLISGEIGRGSFVRATAAEAQHPFIAGSTTIEVIDLSMLKPITSARHEQEMKKALLELSKDLNPRMVTSFRPNIAHQGHRESSVHWLKLCGLEVPSTSVLVTDGATPALTTALVTASHRGATLLVEDITHRTIMPLARYLGINIIAIAMDKDGALPAAFDDACRDHEVCALYLGPNGENPWGYVMPAQRRRKIVEIARQHDVYIIENGVFGPLPMTGLAPLATLAPERTFYATSFSKCVMAGLRSGYLIAPESVLPSALNRHLILNWMANPMSAEIAARWIVSGLAKELTDWQRSALVERHQLVATYLSKGCYRGANNGMHVWVDIPKEWNEEEFVAHARLRGVAVAPSKPFIAGKGTHGSSIRISIGSTSYNDLRRGLEIIANLMVSSPEPSLLIL